MEFLKEMEKAEEILKFKWNEISSSRCKAKSIIEQLLILLKDRQCITSAAFQALDTYDALKAERDELGRRDKDLFQDFTHWLNSDRDGKEHAKEELDAVMELYGDIVKLTRQILTEWKICKKTDQKVGLELKMLNSKFTGFPDKLENSNILEFGKYKWPVNQSKKVSKAVEFSFEQMDCIRELMKELNEKQKILESVFQEKKMKQSTTVTSRPSSSRYFQ